jgi:hypothetical protein
MFDDDRLMRYLIGSLDESETERFDELSITDDDFADRLRIVEDDMIDAYAAGQLPSELRAGFETQYLTLPGKQDRIRFARTLALRAGQAPADESPAAGAEPERRSTPRQFLWPLVAAASIAIAVVGYLMSQRSTQPGRPTQPAASSVSTEPSAARPRADARRRRRLLR